MNVITSTCMWENNEKNYIVLSRNILFISHGEDYLKNKMSELLSKCRHVNKHI